MTDRHTQDEWCAIIKQTEKDLLSANVDHKAVSIASKDFVKIFDHTLLKEDATKEQIDDLCHEAQRYNFKACHGGLDSFG